MERAMKRFADYNLTTEEILYLFGKEDNYKINLKISNKKTVMGDTEKLDIAELLYERGKREESLQMIESIEDSEYRQNAREAYGSWGFDPFTIVN